MLEPNVAVLGAGIQGTCVALSLAQQGLPVLLIDQEPDCLLRASLRNEGKIHLGHVYANDRSRRTSRMMLESALAFAPLIERFTGGPVDWQHLRSRPFTYVVLPQSLVNPERIAEHFRWLDEQYQSLAATRPISYLGLHPDRLWQSAALPGALAAGRALAAMHTPECALNLERFRGLMRTALRAQPRITCHFGHRVTQVERMEGGFGLMGTRHGSECWRFQAREVVNCMWNGRLAIDGQLGVLPRRSWVYRLKYRVLGTLPDALRDLPAMTFVLGPFGDLVTSPDSRDVYLSWYPECMQGWSNDLETPAAWDAACTGCTPADVRDRIGACTLAAFDQIIPGLGEVRVREVDAGVIFSWGKTDIDDMDSELHERFDIGVEELDGYYTVDTGKLTCAPLFAQQVTDRLLAKPRTA